MKLNIILLLICISMLCGCVVRSNVQQQSQNSFDNLSNAYPQKAQDLAQAAAEELGNYYPDNSTISIVISAGLFGESLTQSLRQRGFNPTFSNANNVSYVVDVLDADGIPTQAYVQVRLSDGRLFSISQKLQTMPSASYAQYNDKFQYDNTALLQKPIMPTSASSKGKTSPLPLASLKEDLTSISKAETNNSISMYEVMPSLPSQSLPMKVIPMHAPLIVSKTWRINPGPLRPQLMLWSGEAGYQLVWKASNDFSMESASNFHGKFLQAMEKLFSGLQQSGGHALRVTVYEANKVITISEN